MISALWTGISGLATQQKALDNEAHNIANVNTVGYKATRISFADQLYQDKIGKGAKVLDAEKIFKQGGRKLTGISYDLALNGDGFFAVVNKKQSGTAETFFTRAGNFRRGDNGTLQDAAGNEVQGWAMRKIDTDKNVSSTNPNVSYFTDSYNKLLTSKIVKHSTYIETITAKSTDYDKSAKQDNKLVFSGAGSKSKFAKVSDIEELVKDYSMWLKKLQDDPDVASSGSIAQVSHLNFKGDTLKKESDTIYVYLDGEKIEQTFIKKVADPSLTPAMVGDLTGNGGVPDAADADLAASRIATYKALADQISDKKGFRATTVTNGPVGTVFDNTNPYADVFANGDTIFESTLDLDVLLGMIKIESLIPGKEFGIKEHAETSGDRTTLGNLNSTDSKTAALKGSGSGAVESSRKALSDAVAGKQRDVFTPSELVTFPGTYTYEFTFFDKDTNNNKTIPAAPASFAGVTDITDLASKINADIELKKYITAEVINGNLVLKPIDAYSDIEFAGMLKEGTNIIDRNEDGSGKEGAGAEFMQIVNTIDQTTSKNSLQLRLDTLNISDSAFGEFHVDDTGLITMKQDGAEFAIGQIAIAKFNSMRGLNAIGDNLYAKTNNSGEAIYNLNNNKTAKVESKSLELSTADLSESLVNLMVFQRAFEANAKSITTADQLLNTLINLKR